MRPSAEATRAAPASFIALPRVIAPVFRPVARSSKERAVPSSLFTNNATSPFRASRLVAGSRSRGYPWGQEECWTATCPLRDRHVARDDCTVLLSTTAVCSTEHKVLWCTAPALRREYGSPETGLRRPPFSPLPEVVWPGMHHIWGRPTTFSQHPAPATRHPYARVHTPRQVIRCNRYKYKTCPSELRAALILRKRLLASSVKMITFESPFPAAQSGTLANRGERLSALSSAGYPRAKDRRTVATR
jgi:hypothetical protein